MKRKSKTDVSSTASSSKTEDNQEENGQESMQEDESPSKKKGSKKSKKSRKNLEEANDESNGTAGSSNEDGDEDNESETSKKKSKKGKKGRKSNSNAVESNGTEDNEEESYEVETVLDQTTIRGVKQYLIRWKGYGAESDTWEPESTLSCPDLIQKFLASQKTPVKGKKRSSQGPASTKKKQKTEDADDGGDDDDDEEETVGEYEVDRILEVHHKKNGKREFLVHWKGYTSKDNTWEPEEHMNCQDLIEKFMARVEHAKESSNRELRVDRKPTKHFTLSMEQHGRRLSRRNLGKQRAQYKDFD